MADWNARVIEEFRAKRGRGVGAWGDHLLLLTTRGAKSGVVHTTPLVYHRDGGRYVVAASKGGAPTHPDWYHNLVKHREAEIEVGAERFEVRATPIPRGPERDRLYAAHSEAFAAFRDYPTKTKRVIPVVVLERVPRTSTPGRLSPSPDGGTLNGSTPRSTFPEADESRRLLGVSLA
jgi:deazaflavin-dependent oxidoreductase (nitroreductase family)